MSDDFFFDAYEKEKLHFAVQDGNLDEVKKLICEGWNLNAFDSDMGYTPLMYAVKDGNLEIAMFLIELGADVNLQDEARIGDSALHIAAANGTLEMCQLLLDNGADPMAPGWMWISPMHKAAERTSPEGAKIYKLFKSIEGSERLRERRPPLDKWGSIPRGAKNK